MSGFRRDRKHTDNKRQVLKKKAANQHKESVVSTLSPAGRGLKGAAAPSPHGRARASGGLRHRLRVVAQAHPRLRRGGLPPDRSTGRPRRRRPGRPSPSRTQRMASRAPLRGRPPRRRPSAPGLCSKGRPRRRRPGQPSPARTQRLASRATLRGRPPTRRPSAPPLCSKGRLWPRCAREGRSATLRLLHARNALGQAGKSLGFHTLAYSVRLRSEAFAQASCLPSPPTLPPIPAVQVIAAGRGPPSLCAGRARLLRAAPLRSSSSLTKPSSFLPACGARSSRAASLRSAHFSPV